MSEGTTREQWATRTGFILAAVGSAVGLGNVWRFPFQVGQGGGAAFLVIYLLFVIVVGFPAILVEFTIGRRTSQNPVGALREFAGGAWQYLGGLFILIGFVVLSYYSVVAGWVLRYVIGSARGAYFEGAGEYFLDIAVGPEAILFHAVFTAAVVSIVALGVQRGIELAVKAMVPAIVVLLVALAVYAGTLSEAGAAYGYYLSPDLGTIAEDWTDIVPRAAGQAFFTLSLGMGVMITYASYVGESRNLAEDATAVVAIDTLIAFVTGLIVFPILFSAGLDPADPGAGAIFVSVATAFADLPLGRVIGVAFFGTVAIAALSSAISLMEVVVSYSIDERGWDRRKATAGIGLGMFLLGVPVTVDTVMVDLFDVLASQILLVTGSLALAVLVGWVAPARAIDELGEGIDDLGWRGRAWLWLVRIPVILVLIVSLLLGIDTYVEFLRTDFADFLSGL